MNIIKRKERLLVCQLSSAALAGLVFGDVYIGREPVSGVYFGQTSQSYGVD